MSLLEREVIQRRARGAQTRVLDAEGHFLGWDPGPVPEGWEERLEVVLARRRAAPRNNTDTWSPRVPERPPTWMPVGDPGAAAALNRARLAALRAVEARQAEAEQAEAVAREKRRALEAAAQHAAELTSPPPPLGGLSWEEGRRWLDRLTSEGPALAEARERAGLTQKRLAQLAHFSRSYVGELERPGPRPERTLADGPKALAARRRLALVVARHTYPTAQEAEA